GAAGRGRRTLWRPGPMVKDGTPRAAPGAVCQPPGGPPGRPPNQGGSPPVRRPFLAALPALLALALSARAGLPCGCKTRCIEPPEDHPNCKCPCEKRLNLCPFDNDHAKKYIDRLCPDSTCCERIKAVKKLGSRLCADACKNCEVIETLISTLF